VHAFVATVLLRMARLDAFDRDAEAKPPDRITQILTTPDVELVGPLPSEIAGNAERAYSQFYPARAARHASSNLAENSSSSSRLRSLTASRLRP
jgi:hypothetical protein